MKQMIALFFFGIIALSGYSQTYIQEGDNCFNEGDYTCAVTNYDSAFNSASGRDKQIAEIKLTRANWCAEHIHKANQAFASKNYSTAKDEYQKVLDSNPQDNYVQSQFAKCDNALNPPQLRKATSAEILEIWDNKYGVNPERRQMLIGAGIDPDDAQRRINAGEGKPQEKENHTTNLSVSISTLYFTSYGGTSEQIKVYSNVITYSVPSSLVPSWCTVNTYSGYFTVTASANPNSKSRIDWLKVTVGDKEVTINIEQSGMTSSNSQQLNSPNEQTNLRKCFNCPKTHDTWGLTLGYTQQNINNYSMNVIQIGLKAEPLFKSGLGLNTGINLLGYSKKLFESGFDAYSINIPLNLEDRLNISKWFNIFAYGGIGFNAITNPNFDKFTFPITFEFGGGFRISHVQFNAGKSLYLGNLGNSQNFGKYSKTYQNLILSVSYMF